jgi:hypothetical protein
MNTLVPVFIRHKMDSTPVVLEELWDRRFIALHYDDINSANPDDYVNDRSARQSLSRLWSYCKTGAIVGADFRRIRPTKMLIGEILPGAMVEPKTFRDPTKGKEFIYKVVQLHNSIEVSYLDYPLLAAIQPRQTTLTGWPSAGEYLEAIYRQTPIPLDIKSLHPSQLEVLCYEFLRANNYLSLLLMPIGRGMIDIDIWGINDHGQIVLAQITHSKDLGTIKDKIERLLSYAVEGTVLYLFAPKEMSQVASGVTFQPIEDIFENFINGPNILNRLMIERMLGYKG